MKTTKQVREIYSRLRREPVSMLVGRCAEMALRDARTIARFNELERDGLVRIRSEDEQESYFSVFGREDDEKAQKEMEATLDRLGCVCVLSEYFDGYEWQMADSIGMCVYEDAESPFENCYVSELMRAAIVQAEKWMKEPAERAEWEARGTVTI